MGGREMAAYQDIVFGTDFSEEAKAAFEEAKYMASLSGAKLSVVHVVPGSTTKAVGAYEGEGTEAGTESLRERFPAEGAEYHILRGHEAEQIIRYADARPASLIVIGARGIGRLTGLFGGGSVCDKVVANAKSPVLVVPVK